MSNQDANPRPSLHLSVHPPAIASDTSTGAAGNSAGAAGQGPARVDAKNLVVSFGATRVLKGINLSLHAAEVTAIIGPSGCGKSTFLRAINRMHELTVGAQVQGEILLDGEDIYSDGVDPVLVRRLIGMVFQKPNPFPTMSIRENVLSGLRLTRRYEATQADAVVEDALKGVGLWDEVKDRLAASAGGLSGGQQQRLCIARSIAVEPRVLLMDEPCSALDPIATGKIEELIRELSARYTVAIVTHNMQQAMRVAHRTAFFLSGDLIEVGPTARIFESPVDTRTRDYVRGKFG